VLAYKEKNNLTDNLHSKKTSSIDDKEVVPMGNEDTLKNITEYETLSEMAKDEEIYMVAYFVFD
jgi:hypothetical protein